MKELVEKWAADAAKQLEDRVPTTGMFKQLVVGVIANPKGEYPINFVECKVFNDTFVAYALVETTVPDAIYEENITICKGFAGQPVGAFDSQLRIRQIEMELIRAMRFIFPNLFSGPKQ